MAKGDTQKTEEDRAKEEKLITRLMELVGQRNEVCTSVSGAQLGLIQICLYFSLVKGLA